MCAALPTEWRSKLFPRSAEQRRERWKKHQDAFVSETRGNMSRLSLAPVSANISRKRRAEDEDEHEDIPKQKRFRPAVGLFRTTDNLESAWRRYVVDDSPIQKSHKSRSSSLPPQLSQASSHESARAQANRRLDDRQSLPSRPAQPQARTQGSPDVVGPSAPFSDPFVDSDVEVPRQHISFTLGRPEDVTHTPDYGSASLPHQPTTIPDLHAGSPLSLASIDEVDTGIASEGSVDGHGHNLRSRRTLQERASKVYDSEP